MSRQAFYLRKGAHWFKIIYYEPQETGSKIKWLRSEQACEEFIKTLEVSK